MQKRKLLLIIILVFVLFLVWLLLFVICRTSYNINYKIHDNNIIYNISEIYNKKTNLKRSNYYFEINVSNNKFNFQIYNNLKKKKVIKKIYYYEDSEYKCLLPIFFGGKQLIDMICISNSEYKYYHDIVGEDEKLDKFVKKIKNYDINNFKNNEVKNNDNLVLSHVFNDQYYFLLENYKGLYIINDGKVKYNISLFDNDVYQKPIKYFVDKYFIIADYNEKYDFHKFYVIDITNGKTSEIISDISISMDSYIQGVVDGCIYLFDPASKKQFLIDYKHKKIKLFNDGSVMLYKNNKWIEGDLYTAIDEKLLFDYYDSTTKNSKYSLQKEINNYIYSLREEDGNYLLYRSDVQKKDSYIFIAKISDENRLYYTYDSIYYVDKGYVKVFNDDKGTKTLLYNRELEFNNDLLIGMYIKY